MSKKYDFSHLCMLELHIKGRISRAKSRIQSPCELEVMKSYNTVRIPKNLVDLRWSLPCIGLGLGWVVAIPTVGVLIVRKMYVEVY